MRTMRLERFGRLPARRLGLRNPLRPATPPAGRGTTARAARRLAAAGLLFGLTVLGGCAGLGMSSQELELLEGSAAEARFMDRSWPTIGEAERREFAAENAKRWTYFNDLVHGCLPVAASTSSTSAAAQAGSGTGTVLGGNGQ